MISEEQIKNCFNYNGISELLLVCTVFFTINFDTKIGNGTSLLLEVSSLTTRIGTSEPHVNAVSDSRLFWPT